MRKDKTITQNRLYRFQQFVNKATHTHANRYDYSNVNYVNSYTPIEIICPIHGAFYQKPYQHSIGSGCKKCTKVTRTDISTRFRVFLLKANIIHGHHYDYSKVNYVNSYTPVEIICPVHGSFYQTPYLHNTTLGCQTCNVESRTGNKHDFIKKCNTLFDNKYNYEKIPLVFRSADFVEIGCPIHGSFKQRAGAHLSGKECHPCAWKKRRNSPQKFINKANKIHHNKYNYDKVKYINCHTKVMVTCKEHGTFLVAPANHTKKTNPTGCKKCKSSHGQNKIRKVLQDHNLTFIEEYRFDDCRNKHPLPFDFYIPELHTLIEFDGKQHFVPVSYFGGEHSFQTTKQNDKIKNKYAEDKNIKLIRIPYTEIKNIENIIQQVTS